MQARIQAAQNTLKVLHSFPPFRTQLIRFQAQMQKVRAGQLTFEAQLLEPEFVFQALGFTHFLSTWLIRQVDPNHKHPNPPVRFVRQKGLAVVFR